MIKYERIKTVWCETISIAKFLLLKLINNEEISSKFDTLNKIQYEMTVSP